MEQSNVFPVYSSEVQQRFAAPRRAGRIERGVQARKVSSSRHAELLLQLVLAGGRVAEARFQAVGCPHLIAAADLVCERLESMPVSALEGFRAAFLEQELPLPADKLDIRILIEDAVRDAARQLN